jgi:hypothetical protein
MPTTRSVVCVLALASGFKIDSLGILLSSPLESHPQFLQQSLMVVELFAGKSWSLEARSEYLPNRRNTMPAGSTRFRAAYRSRSL